MANGQTLTDDELAKKYGPGSHAAATDAGGLSEEDLTQKYGATAEAGTPAVTAIEKAGAIPKNYGFTVKNIGENLKSLGTGALTMGKDILFPEGKTEGERLKFLGKKYLFDPAEHERELAQRGDQSTLESIGHSTAAAIPFIGPFVGSLAEQAGRGDIGGATAQGAGAYFGGKALGKVAKGATDVGIKTLPKIAEIAGRVAGERSLAPVGEAIGEGYQGVKDVIGEKTRMPDQSLKPKTAAAAGVASSYLLSHLGGGGEGLMAELLGGGYLGPKAAELLLPKHPGVPAEAVTPIKTTPFAGATSSAESVGSAKLPPVGSVKLPTIAPAAAESIAKPAGAVPAPTRLPTLFEKGTRPAMLKMPNLIDQAAGVKPLKPDVPLIEQLTAQTAEEPAAIDPMKAKYPDPAVRQMVRANGERAYEAAKDDPALMKDLHNLTRVDLRQALVNAGEDMGQTTVSNSKFAGEGSIPREEAFNRLLDKGLKPEEILKLAKPGTNGAGGELKAGQSTADRYYDPKAKAWNPERAKLHDTIAAEAVKDKVPPAGRPPEATITMGGTGSGKTTVARSIVADDPNLVNVDSDANKLKIPEYEKLKKADPQKAAARVHEESKAISKRMIQEIVSKGLDFMYDTSTGGGGADLFKKLKELGYRVKVLYTDVPVDEAIARSRKRAAESTDPSNRGRFVPDDIVRQKHAAAAKAFAEAKSSPHIDEIHGFDTTTRTPAKFFERTAAGEKVYNRETFDRVAKKAGKQP